jgi:hypothetical protein
MSRGSESGGDLGPNSPGLPRSGTSGTGSMDGGVGAKEGSANESSISVDVEGISCKLTLPSPPM